METTHQEPSLELSPKKRLLIFVVLVIFSFTAYGIFLFIQSKKGELRWEALRKGMEQESLLPCYDLDGAGTQGGCFDQLIIGLGYKDGVCAELEDSVWKEHCESHQRVLRSQEGLISKKRDLEYETATLSLTFQDGEEGVAAVLLADNVQQRTQGLSYRTWEHRAAMLFEFDNVGVHPFHMKDMFISLDMYFLDEQYNILRSLYFLDSCLVSGDGCPLIGEDLDGVKYVLEVPSSGRRIISIAPIDIEKEE